MRKILLIAAILVSLTAGAQVHNDASKQMRYVNIEPQSIPAWMQYQVGAPQINRLYMKLVDDDLGTSAIFTYQLCGAVVIDGNTTNYVPIKTGTYTISGSSYATWDANDNSIPFKLLAPVMNLVITD